MVPEATDMPPLECNFNTKLTKLVWQVLLAHASVLYLAKVLSILGVQTFNFPSLGPLGINFGV